MRVLKDQIIVLKTTRYSDSHLIVVGINKSGAKLSLLAPAALKSKKRFAGGALEPSRFITIQYQTPVSEGRLPTLKEAQVIEGFDGLRQDYDRLNMGFYFLKIVERVAQEESQDSQSLFSLLAHGLKALEEARDLSSFKKHFEIKLLYTQGLLSLQEGIEDILKEKFSNNIHLDSQFESGAVYSRIRSLLEDYVGF